MKKWTFGLGIVLIFCIAAVVIWSRSSEKPAQPVRQDPLIPYLHLNRKVNAQHFNQFLTHCNTKRLNMLLASLEKQPTGKQSAVEQFRREFLWASSHWLPYLGKNTEEIPYHEIVCWAAREQGVSEAEVNSLPTFALERKIFESVFEKTWDKLTPEQRRSALAGIKTDQSQWQGIVGMSGAAAVASLSTSTAINGFAFYTGMSSLLYSAAQAMSLSLPFWVYTGASTGVAIASGPIGWIAGATALSAGVAFVGRANPMTVSQAIIQIHCIKVEALEKSGRPLPGL